MTLIDTHAHIYLEDFNEDINEVMERAENSGITKILLPNIDTSTIELMTELEDHYPSICHSMIGLHPCSVKEDYKDQLKVMESWLEKRKFIGIGEIGTDLYWDKTFWNEQQQAFRIQCELAIETGLPVAIHCRESIDETIRLVKEFENRNLTGVFHCFTGTTDQANQIVDLGFYLGLGGVSTFKNGGLSEVVPTLDLNRIVLETDSPYLSPAPERGKRNEPGKVKIIAEKISQILDVSLEEVSQLTTKNANRLFFRS